MMDKKPLTPTQRRILKLLAEHGSAAIMGQRGRVGMAREMRVYNSNYGVVIEAYQGPDYFLKNRGLIERSPSNAPGCWYRLTDDGRRRAAALT
jgi:DNA-binding MarR family transcriptional regulator